MSDVERDPYHGGVTEEEVEAASSWLDAYVQCARDAPELTPDEAWAEYQQECIDHISLMNRGVPPPANRATRQQWRDWYAANTKEGE